MVTLVLHVVARQIASSELTTNDQVKLRLVFIDYASALLVFVVPHKVEWEKTTCGQLHSSREYK